MKTKKKLARKIVLITVGAIAGLFLIIALVGMITVQNMKNTGLPRIDIVTENGAEILSKEHYVNCTVSLSEAEEAFCF